MTVHTPSLTPSASALQQQQKSKLLVYITVGVTLIVGTGLVTYQLIEQDRQVKRRKQTRQAERQVLQLIHQIQLDRQTIDSDIVKLTRLVSKTVQRDDTLVPDDVDSKADDEQIDDKEWKRRDFVVAECNELLLRLLERLDAIQPKSAILGEDTGKPSAFEAAAILDIRNRKKKVIRQIERSFRNLDQCKDLLNGLGDGQ